MGVIKGSGMYEGFVGKWLRYMETFKGSVLKKVSLVLADKLEGEEERRKVD